jgi:hypothetical protein
MRVIKLDGNLLGKFPPGSLCLLESADDIIKRGSTPEVLLLQAKFFASLQTDTN